MDRVVVAADSVVLNAEDPIQVGSSGRDKGALLFLGLYGQGAVMPGKKLR
ncbi:hypothetical protein [Verrucomicrobium sp. 3C]|nr:hypothetical protein [Verrucomicrobium sp. 3C]